MSKILKIKRCCDCAETGKTSNQNHLDSCKLYCMQLVTSPTPAHECEIINRNEIKANCPLKQYKKE
jgi:hypothetical protein